MVFSYVMIEPGLRMACKYGVLSWQSILIKGPEDMPVVQF